MRLAVGRRRGRGVDGGEPVGHLRADHERPVAAVRGPQGVDPIGVDVAEQDELPDQPLDHRADRVVVEAVPLVVGRPERQVDVAARLGMFLVISLEHRMPLLVVHAAGRTAAAVHRDDQGPAVGRLRADVPPEVGTRPVLGRDRLRLELAPERLVDRRGLVGRPGDRAHRLVPGQLGQQLLAVARFDSSPEKRSAKIRDSSARVSFGPGRSRSTRTTVSPETVTARTAAPPACRATTRSDPLGGAGQVRWRLMSADGPRLLPSARRDRRRPVERRSPRPRRVAPAAAPRPSIEPAAAVPQPVPPACNDRSRSRRARGGLVPDHREEARRWDGR